MTYHSSLIAELKKTETMKKLFLFGIGLMLLSSASLCNAQDTTVSRAVPAFSGLNASQGIRVNVKIGDSTIVNVTAPETDIDKVITEVKSGTLLVHFKSQTKIKSIREVVVDVTTPVLDRVVATSGSTIVASGLKSNNFITSCSSGSQITADIEATSITAEAKAGSSLTLLGKAKKISCKASSGASFNAKDLVTAEAKVEASSGANVTINAESTLEAVSSSGASINYYGNATVTDVRASSGGSIRHK